MGQQIIAAAQTLSLSQLIAQGYTRRELVALHVSGAIDLSRVKVNQKETSGDWQ